MLRLSTLALLLALGASKLENVKLQWRPTDEPGDVMVKAAKAFKSKKVQVAPFTDSRENKALIGQNNQDKTPRDVTTTDDVGAWCATQMAGLLKRAGVAVVSEGGDVVISGQVMSFMVDERDVYQGTIVLNLAVSGGGKQIWADAVSGSSKRWGRTYKEDNYMETLSDALSRASEAFFGDAKLSEALAK
ncbi:MAG TPA: hypothetical protein VMU15_01895 [Anaeromyxobacter sp.]|nr:hypothetical protein [Anaeromyxobacter sp.]